jgi:hypothetical protein
VTGGCDRFERERLLEIAEGRPAGDHFADCPDCREAARRHQVLAELLGHSDGRRQPPLGWEQATLAFIHDAERARRRRRRALQAVGAAVALAAAVVLAFALRPRPAPPSPELALAVEVTRGSEPMRGDMARLGDRLAVSVRAGAAARLEVRVYRDDRELVARCTTEPPCRRTATGVAAEVVLGNPGRYQVLVVDGRPPPDPPGGLDRDASQAAQAGGAVLISAPIEVY